MTDMKFKFTIQPYQTAAVESVVRVFAGQPFQDRRRYRRDTGSQMGESDMFSEAEVPIGFANASVALEESQLLHNIQIVQNENNIRQSDGLAKHLGCCALDVEMETGTGKTYVYIKTMFELNKLYGWSKFIVVVPSIAIREGVQKSFVTMQDHFMEYYGKKARFFVYNSKNLTDIDAFSSSAELSVMIINMQAFNSSFDETKNEEGRKGDKTARIIFSTPDRFGSRRPIDVIKANRPIIILDEPQKIIGIKATKTKKALEKFNPLFMLNYSATHKEHHNLVYELDALDAYRMKLVKKIEVKGFDIRNLQGTNGYLFLESIVISPDKPPRARLEFEIGHNKSIRRETRIVGVDDDLYALSKSMEQYQGYHINEIDPIQGVVNFTNGTTIHTGEVQGDVSEQDIRRVQIRETIRSHFEKEKELYERGIKTLSLFFIDKVEHYRKYDEAGNLAVSEYGQMFEEEYTSILNEYLTLFDTPYEQYLRKIDVQKTHQGYFSIDKKGHAVDSKIKRGDEGSDDESAYELILKDKERLLSFDNPVRFIFSHSALREGWDNPNVFQICTLKHGGDSTTSKRQEVGRGLRICVDQSGDRMDAMALGSEVQKINKLTVIASEGYQDFVSGLQKDIREDLYERPTKATAEYFAGKRLEVGGDILTVTDDQARAIYFYLIKNDYVDEDGQITEQYRADAANQVLAPLPEKAAMLGDGVHTLIQSIFDEHALDGMIEDGHQAKVSENPLNDNFYKKEFQTLWGYINHKYTYTVEFDSEELIKKAIAHINEKMFVARLQYTVTKGEQGKDWTADHIKQGIGFAAESSHTFNLARSEGSQVRYDLVGKLASGTHLTRRSITRILSGIDPLTFAMFQANPEEFMAKAIRLIKEQKATMIVDDITYNRTSQSYDSEIFTAEKNNDFTKAYAAKKNVQAYVFADGYAKESGEKKFARAMDLDDKVVVYAKLPRGFRIPTPVGNYAPDWAIAFQQGTVKHIFFVAETKGTMETLNLKPIEQAKIKCAKKLFNELSTEDVVYHDVDTYQHLLDVMEAI